MSGILVENDVEDAAVAFGRDGIDEDFCCYVCGQVISRSMEKRSAERKSEGER